MGVQTSLKISRGKAIALVFAAMNDMGKLKELVNVVLNDSLYNCYMIVDNDDESDDGRLP